MEKTGNITVLEAKSRFKKVDVSIIENENIDCLTLGIYTKLIVLGKKWNLNVRGLRKHLGLSDEKVRKSLSLLEHEGYIVRTPCRNDKGQLLGWNYAIYPIPVDEYNRSQAGRETKKQPTEEPSTPETEYPENRPLGEPTTRQAEYTETGGDINNRLNVSYKLNEYFKKDIDKSISQKDTEQGCGTSLPPSDASLPFPPASDAPSPDAVGSSENTACGVNVNSFRTPLPPTPRVSSDVDVDVDDSSNANKSKRKKHKAKFDVYADLSYVDEAYVDIWREWLEYKDAINKQYNVQKGAISQYKSLLRYADNNVILANAIVKKSIEHSWNGLFGLSDKEKELYLSERSPYYVKSNEPALPNGMTRETYEIYIRNGYEIDEYGRIYKDGIMLK